MRIKTLTILLIYASALYAQDTLTSGRLVFKQKNSSFHLPNDTIWYSPSIKRTTCEYFDLNKKQHYYRLDNNDIVCIKKEVDEKEAMRGVKKLKTFFYNNDTLTFAGIKCNKAVVQLQMQNDSIYRYSVYYSSQVGGKKANYYNIYRDIPGIPLYISNADNDDYCIELVEYKPLNISDLIIPKLSDGFMFQGKRKKN